MATPKDFLMSRLVGSAQSCGRGRNYVLFFTVDFIEKLKEIYGEPFVSTGRLHGARVIAYSAPRSTT